MLLEDSVTGLLMVSPARPPRLPRVPAVRAEIGAAVADPERPAAARAVTTADTPEDSGEASR